MYFNLTYYERDIYRSERKEREKEARNTESALITDTHYSLLQKFVRRDATHVFR